MKLLLFILLLPASLFACHHMNDAASSMFALYKFVYGEPPRESRPNFPRLIMQKGENNLPRWAGSFNDVEDYYKLHEESQLDRNLCKIAALSGVIVHGNLNNEKLASHLAGFDVAELMQKGAMPNKALSIEAQKLIFDSLQGLPRVLDIHIHNPGYDEQNYLNPKISSFKYATWNDYFKFMVLRYASGMTTPKNSTEDARMRIHLYSANFPKLSGFILPIHPAFLKSGEIDWENTGDCLCDESALQTATSFQSTLSSLKAAVSIHPYDPAWREKLTEAKNQGIYLVKWMPPQSIPPDDEDLIDFYNLMAEYKMTLIAHSGVEHTVPPNAQSLSWADFGNPLRFRLALKQGVDVILAHSGHKDLIPDLDHPEKVLVPGHQLFIRIAREAHKKNLSGEWQGRVFGDLAAVTTHYGPDFIKALLEHVNEEGIRFIYGSDYPFTNLIQPNHDAYELCAKAQLLDEESVAPLKEIRNWNPLLANFVFTKNLTFKHNGKTLSFPDSTFTGEALHLFH